MHFDSGLILLIRWIWFEYMMCRKFEYVTSLSYRLRDHENTVPSRESESELLLGLVSV